jgi:O-methyltransferase
MMVTRNRPLLPMSTLNNILLRFPFIYRMNFVKYESGLRTNHGLDDIMLQLKNARNIEGDIIECGCDRCGTSVIMAKYLKSTCVNKRIYALDVFGHGFEPKELEEERSLGLTQATTKTFRYNSLDYVKSKIRTLGFGQSIIPIKGLFKDTLPHIESRFCLCLIDCDLSKSMLYCAETIWPRLSKKGIMLFDDYGSTEYKGVKIAVDTFLEKYRDEISSHGLLNRLYQVTKADTGW